MYKHCSTEESVRRQRQIEQYLLDLMHTVPYTRITVGDLCRTAEISRKTFYRYFGSKEDCLHGLIDHSLLDASEAYLADNYPNSGIRRILEHYFTYWQQSRLLLEALFQNQLTNVLFDRSMLLMVREDLEYRNLLHYAPCDDAPEQLIFIITGIMGLILNWHISGYRKSAAQMAATVEHLLANSLISEAHRS